MSPIADRLLALTRGRCSLLAAWMEALWRAGQTSPDQGPAIGAGEVARLLATQDVPALPSDMRGQDPEWAALQAVFGLSDAEADLLGLCVAVELDPGLGRVLAYLHDDGRMLQPTPWLAARLCGRPPVPFGGEGLLRWNLAAPVEGNPGRLMTPWQADLALVLSVAGGGWHDPVVAELAEIRAPDHVADLPVLHPAALAALHRADDLRGIELVGPPGIGRRTLAAQFAAASGRTLLAIDLASPEPITRVLRQAAITGALAYFGNAELVAEQEWVQARRLGVPYLRGVRRPTGEGVPVTLAPLTISARAELWRHLHAAAPPPALRAHRLTPREIVAGELAPRSRRPDGALMTRLPCPYEWDDLVLPPDVRGQLREFETQVRLRWTVYEEWGFGRLTHLGHGISALFGGPSGTGKTMAAQVVARSLGIELLRVDLAGVVNKYVGETEKKLCDVFDACEDSGALLFFDEADALFGTRTQVKDAHDRFANIEIDYLLQRIERFDGVAILATNRRQDLDSAFVRRLRFVIEFMPPRVEERLALWSRALLPAAPSGEEILEDVDLGFLADRLTMTGAEIKSTALGAAFLARAEGARIGMRHLLAAAQRELAKQGVKMRAPLQEAR